MKRDEPERGEARAPGLRTLTGDTVMNIYAPPMPSPLPPLRSELLFFDVLLLNSLTQSTKAAANQMAVGHRYNYLTALATTNHADRHLACNN